ncbi:hypothetical protein [Sporosarcina sp. SAFN-015]|uniref:hypothetical protein n=1 Tax=Sporosarcina sp. SAFN-015 TaxID=3387274 RepID=UPI003F7D741D
MKPLTTQDLEAIRKRAEAATVGPWKYNDQHGYLAPVTPQREICAITNEITRYYDAEFIAHAREDIPALLAEVERLRDEIESHAPHGRNYTNQQYVDLLTKYEDMTSIALWSTRRLSHRQHKDFAYDAIERNLGREVERV